MPNISYTYRLKPTDAEKHRIDNWIGVCRLVWNMSLGIKIDAYRSNVKVSFHDIAKQLKDFRAEYKWAADLPSHTLANPIYDLGRAYDRFFKKGGFPKFKSKKEECSLFLKTDKRTKTIRQLSATSFNIPKIGKISVFKDRPPTGEIVCARIAKKLGKYYLIIVCKKEATPMPLNDNQIGLDVGLASFVTMSSGASIEHPKYFYKLKETLRVQQRKLSRKKKGGKNREKQKLVVAKLYNKISNQRADFIHKLTTEIIKTNQVICLEKLNIKGMIKSNLSARIGDSGWGLFRQHLKYKSELYGRELLSVNPKYTSQQCNVCQFISSGNRTSQSSFKCLNCGHLDNADINAAKNILRVGQTLLAQSTDNSLRLAKELKYQMPAH